MTWGELNKYAENELTSGIANILDWRPAAWEMIDDIVTVENDRAYVARGIRYWLANGDAIIYVKKTDEQEGQT